MEFENACPGSNSKALSVIDPAEHVPSGVAKNM
jgi:hypothetical protein